MKHLTFRLRHRAGTLRYLLATACLLAGPPLAQAIVNPEQHIEVWMAASNKTLDSMRGGFDLGAGLLVSFGITRSVSINGSLIVTTSFNIPNLSMITPQQAALVNQQVGSFNLVQNGPGNTVQSSSTVAASSVSPGPLAVNTVSPGAGPVTVGSATVTSVPINGASLGTFIQNTLNNQQIQSQTVINASTNSLGMYKGMNMYSALNGAQTSSLGTR